MRLAPVIAVAALLVSPIVAAQDAAPPIVPLPVVPPPLVSPTAAPPSVAPAAPPPAESVATAAPATPAAYANRSGAFGVGVNIGNRVSGVSLKLWASPGVAAEATAGGGAEGNNLRAHVGLDF